MIIDQGTSAERPYEVLIADDDLGDRKIITRAIKNSALNSSITEVPDVDAAVAFCEDREFDCVFIDYLMPGLDGLKGVSAIKKKQPFAAIVMVTGQGDEAVATRALKLGADDYIRKSIIQPAAVRRILLNAVHRAELRKKAAAQREELQLFARTLVHDLKSPIRAVSQISTTVIESIASGSHENLADDCRFLQEAAARMSALIMTLQEYTVADSNVHFEDVDLNLVFEAAIKNLSLELVASDAVVNSDKLPIVRGNFALLIQLFQNLISNGIKFCRDVKPSVHVGMQNGSDGQFTLVFIDNGMGIPVEQHNIIFEPFRKLDSSRTFEGTGLGLATCRKIMERHNGKILCKAIEGPGACFSVTFGVDI